eukprot:712162-Prymnesium_polylepis.2
MLSRRIKSAQWQSRRRRAVAIAFALWLCLRETLRQRVLRRSGRRGSSPSTGGRGNPLMATCDYSCNAYDIRQERGSRTKAPGGRPLEHDLGGRAGTPVSLPT